MAADLSSLPIEIVQQILRCDDWAPSRRYVCEVLRLTCKELNAKILRYYGREYYKKIHVPLTESRSNAYLGSLRWPAGLPRPVTRH
jgi:hypothetical protein